MLGILYVSFSSQQMLQLPQPQSLQQKLVLLRGSTRCLNRLTPCPPGARQLLCSPLLGSVRECR